MSYGCYNRPPLKDHHWVQAGHRLEGRMSTRSDLMIPIVDLMTKTCQYQKDDKYNDPGCVGCCHKTLLSGHILDLFPSTQGSEPKQPK